MIVAQFWELENEVTFFAFTPMLMLLVVQAGFAIMDRPALVAPATFYFVGVVRVIVEMLTYSIVVEVAAAAGWHGWMSIEIEGKS